MEGLSPNHASAASGPKRPGAPSGPRRSSSSSSGRKDFLRKFVNNEMLTASLEDWFSGICEESNFRKPAFDAPFELTELQNFDYALEDARFQQLIRMPNALQASTSDAVEATAHLAIEDFLHAGLKGLWETFWGQDSPTPMPFSVACIHSTGSKFYSAERAIASGKLDGLCATAILFKNGGNSGGKWDQIVGLTLLRPDIGTLSMQGDQEQPHSALGEALFFAIRVLVSQGLSRTSAASRDSNCVFMILVDSQYGGVVKVDGDINRLDLHAYNVYESGAEWIRKHAKISISTIDRVWNKLGNANWGDVGTLQILLAVFRSMVRFCGAGKLSPEELAAEHGSRLLRRRSERGNGIFCFQQQSASPEIVEVKEEKFIETVPPEEALNLEKGSVVCLEDSNWQKAFRVNGRLPETEVPMYSAAPVEDPAAKLLILYVGSCPAHMDINLWYLVQRQTKVLNLMNQRGLSSKHLPRVSASGRIVHPGQCDRPSAGENCRHPWCGTPVLVTSPHGETVSYMIRNGLFGTEEALRCCHDCLSAISAASSAGIRHGDIRPDSLICVSSGESQSQRQRSFFVLIGWGHAVLEEKDRPAMNLYFSSTYALQQGKLCAASDAESLIYLLYHSCGGVFPDLDSVEGALEWREMAWSRRVIQQKLGEISAVLKAMADYVDSLCGTPYPMDYGIWLRRLRRAMSSEDHGKEIDSSSN